MSIEKRWLAALTLWRKFSLKRLLLQLTGIMLGLQVLIVFVLQIISVRRKRHQPQGGFHHQYLEAVKVGKNKVQLFDYGRELYDAMLAAIDGARESIYLETYIWKSDAVGQAFKDHLARKAAEGVEVYVIFDDFANIVVPGKFKVFPSNINVLRYQAIRSPLQLFDLRRYALDHRKLLIVDGSVGFIGGYNPGALYSTRWRETPPRMSGEDATIRGCSSPGRPIISSLTG